MLTFQLTATVAALDKTVTLRTLLPIDMDVAEAGKHIIVM
jgi:hypothetical protein